MFFNKYSQEKPLRAANSPVPHADVLTHKKALELFAEEERGKILDTPAGEGYASVRLREMKFDVYAADLDEGDFKIKDIKFDKIDLNKPLIYSDCFFDYILCLEGIEHIENHHHLIREFRRLLRIGGKVVISTPNVLSVYSRLRYFLTGYADWIHSKINLPKEKKTFDLLEQHIHMIDYPTLHYILTENGFNIETISFNRSCLSYFWGKWYLRPFVFTIFAIASFIIRFFCTVIKKDITLSEILLENSLFYGETMIVKAKRIS